MPGLAGRNQVAFDDIHYSGTTLPVDGTTLTYDATTANGIPAAVTGRAVTLANVGGRVCAALAADGDAVVGRLMRIAADGFCTVADEGFVVLAAGTAATVTPGRRIVGALLVAAKGYIREVLAATTAEQARGIGVVWDNNDLLNVVVKFG